MDNAIFAITMSSFFVFNMIITGCLSKRTRRIEERVKALEDKNLQATTATAPVLPLPQPMYPMPTSYYGVATPSAPPVPMYQARY